MQQINRHIAALLLILGSINANAQKTVSPAKGDTIVIYETIMVYDTIYVYDTIKIRTDHRLKPLEPKRICLNMLQLDTIHKRANILSISGNRTATIPIDGIIVDCISSEIREYNNYWKSRSLRFALYYTFGKKEKNSRDVSNI